MRLLIWLALALLVILAVRKSGRARSGSGDAGTAAGSRRQESSEAMVRCCQCQIYLPSSEAVYRGDNAYCCTEHADMHSPESKPR